MADKKKWQPFFIPPDLYELVKDLIMNKGDELGIYSPRILGIKAVEKYLSIHGYKEQVEMIQNDFQKRLKPRAPILSLDRLKENEREAVLYLMNNKKKKMQEAIQWVIQNPDKLEEALDVEH